MVLVKMIRNTYGGADYLENACHYPTARIKIDNDELKGLGGYGIDPYNPDVVHHQMLMVKLYFGKEQRNPLIHYIVSFDESVQDTSTACKLADQMARYFKDNYQILWVVHAVSHGCSAYHAHLILNSVSFVNGRMYHSDIGEMEMFCRYVSRLTGRKVRLFIDGNTK